jgi:hypothetical protein
MCTVPLPSGVNPIAGDKYVNINVSIYLMPHHGSGGTSPASHRGGGLDLTSVRVRCGEKSGTSPGLPRDTLHCRYHAMVYRATLCTVGIILRLTTRHFALSVSYYGLPRDTLNCRYHAKVYHATFCTVGIMLRFTARHSALSVSRYRRSTLICSLLTLHTVITRHRRQID